MIYLTGKFSKYIRRIMETILNLPYPIKIIGASFTICSVMCLYLSEIIFSRFDSYKNASEKIKKNWNVRFVSTIHAVVMGILTTVILTNNLEVLHENPVWGKPFGAETAISIMVGYMIEDLLMVSTYVWAGWRIGLPDIVHHVTAIIVAGSVLKYKYIYAVTLVRAWSECSTPFVHIRWFMMKSNMEDNKWYLRNGLLLALLFFICRIFIMPYLYTINYLFYDEVKTLGSLQLLIVLGMAMDFLNLTWFKKIISLILAHIKNTKKE